MKRRSTVELRTIIETERQLVSPPPIPPAPAGSSLREWFAGLALSNPLLMRDIDIDCREIEAVRIADEMMRALRTPRVPSQESMRSPSESDLNAWSERLIPINEERERRVRATIPELPTRKTPSMYPRTLTGLVPPPLQASPSEAVASFKEATNILRASVPPPPTVRLGRCDGRYSILKPEER